MQTAAIIQTRMNSRRMPLKPMLHLKGLPIIDWVIHRVAQSTCVDRIIVSISNHPLDDALADHLENMAIEVVRGDEEDILSRLVLAAEYAGADTLIRVLGNNPLVWGPEIDRLAAFFEENEVDYAYNHIPTGNVYPEGIGAEIFRTELLERLMALPQSGPDAMEKMAESFLMENPPFSSGTFDPKDLRLISPQAVLSLHRPEDYRRLLLMPIHPGMHPAEVLLRYPKRDLITL